MTHQFNTTLARVLGIDEAIIIEQLYWWIHKNECEEDETMIKDGRVWCRSSAKGFNKYIDYMSAQKIRRVLRTLEELEVIKVGNFNKVPTNQTLWYTFSDKFKNVLEEVGYQSSKMKNGMFKNEQSINNLNDKNINKEENIKEEKKNILSNDNKKSDDLFDLFWKKYKKGSKKAALKAWNKLKDKQKEAALNNVDAYLIYCKRSDRPLKDVSTYLNNECFNDDWSAIPDCYQVSDFDDDRTKRFKKYMVEKFPDLIYHRNPLTFEQCNNLIEENNCRLFEEAMRRLCGRDIHQYYSVKIGVETILKEIQDDDI